MQTTNADAMYDHQNRLKRRLSRDDKTIDAKLRHIRQFERAIGAIDFRAITEEKILNYRLSRESRLESDEENSLSASTIVHALGDVTEFLEALATQPGYSAITRDLIDCLKPAKRTVQLAHGPSDTYSPPLEHILAVIYALPAKTIWERRDRAVVAFAVLSGARASVIRTLRLKHIDIENRTVFQDAKVVDTKNSKTMLTSWFPVGLDIERLVIDWIKESRSLGAGDEDPLFPKAPNKIRARSGENTFEFWSTIEPIRAVFVSGAQLAQVPYFNPHAVRHTLTKLMFKFATSGEEMKAWSQSLGHDDLGTTFKHYGTLDSKRVHSLIGAIRERLEDPTRLDLAEQIKNASPEHLEIIRGILRLGNSNLSLGM
ncbi:tyrosine-type recombinase/integrase [Mesorhizobium sp. ASY16-5R]|uniref:tyrosine-type recombinase/integrase n=1 Tax=Mesorhizobium sp. ASY16-5R TaxID=3445772 RepID=UPI003F9EFCB0